MSVWPCGLFSESRSRRCCWKRTPEPARTREVGNTQPPELRFRALLGEETEVELALVWDPRAPLAATRRR